MNLRNPLSWLSLGFGSGLSPVAPGTAGSTLALAIYYFLLSGLLVTWIDSFFFLLFIVISFLLGLYIYPRTVEEETDPGSYVWDEFGYVFPQLRHRGCAMGLLRVCITPPLCTPAQAKCR